MWIWPRIRRRRTSGSSPERWSGSAPVQRRARCSLPIRMATVRAGLRTASGLRFISNKEGGSQVWIADFDGAAGAVTGVHKLTSIATEAGGELWSPDGKNILFTSDVYPECDGAPEAEDACNARKVKEAEDSKVKAIIFDRLLYRHWNAYKRGQAHAIIFCDRCRLTTVLPQVVGADTRAGVGNIGVVPLCAISRPATTMRLRSRWADRTTMPSRPTGRRFATPRTTTRSKPRPPTTISGSSR